MPRKFDHDAKDRVVRLVEDRILAENMSMQAACQAVAPKLGGFMAHGSSMDPTGPPCGKHPRTRA